MARAALKPAAAPGVLPREAELQAFASAAAQLLVERQPRSAGSRVVNGREGAGLQHLDHRDYAPGDEVRHIDWRQTARRRTPVVRRFEAETVADWTLIVDASSSMATNHGAKWQAARAGAAAMAWALLQLGHRVGLLAFGERVLAETPPGRGAAHYAAIARQLVALEPRPQGERSSLAACVRHVQGASSLFVIADFLADAEMRRDLSALLPRCTALHVLQLRDAADTRLPAARGELEVVDVESGERVPVQGAGAAVQAAAARVAATLRLRRFCLQRGAAFTDWDVAAAWQPTLLRHLVHARRHC